MQTSAACSFRGCSRPVVTIFRHESLCLDHFCSKSYEFLDSVDQHLQSGSASASCTTEQLRVADECERKALDVCLSKMILHNLGRARLLDVLLWSADIVNCSQNAASRQPVAGDKGHIGVCSSAPCRRRRPADLNFRAHNRKPLAFITLSPGPKMARVTRYAKKRQALQIPNFIQLEENNALNTSATLV